MSYLVIATRHGIIKKTPLEAFRARPRGGQGTRAMSIHDTDDVAASGVSSGNDDIIIVTRLGLAIRFHESDVRPMGPNAAGVIGIRVVRDEVASMTIVNPLRD